MPDPPKPKRVSEAQRQMQERLELYQQQREKRVKEKEKKEAEEREKKARERAERIAKEEEIRNKWKNPGRNRSKSPMPKSREPAKKSGDDEAEAARAKQDEDTRAKIAEAKGKKMAAGKADKKDPEQLAQEQAARKESRKKEAEEVRKKAAKEQAQIEAAEQKAQKKAEEARLQKWKEQEKKRKAEAAKKGEPAPVERVPKLSALLAMGGPEAEEYKKKAALAKLATWQGMAGDRWEILEQTFEGKSMSEVTKDEVVTGMPLEEAVFNFKSNPEKYVAMHYWPEQPDRFTFILRAGTIGYEPMDIRTDGSGRLVIWRHVYKRLDPLKENVLPAKFRDKYTDSMTFEKKKLHVGEKNKPLLPGRGMGIGDEANMEMIGECAQPAHVWQGACVGDCWLLSAIACLADFDFAIQRLFRKTKSPKIGDRPLDEANQYTVTLWDLKTWKEVDIVVDERLPVRADGSGYLLGAKPSKDGKFWVPYLEKAIAAHCGGYDKICGGNCTDAWPMLTGSRNQFVITKNPKTKKYVCGAKYNPQTEKWSDHSNSPHDSNPANWQVEWPTVGGGGDKELNENELFHRIITWDENNFLIGAGTDGATDKQSTDGIVDNHAYSVIDSRQNICKTGIDLLLIRNPWGQGGELKNGQFMRSGPGWKRYPDIQKELNPSMEDNGLCWVTKEEFFRYFPTIYVCALNITRLKDAKYINDLNDHFERRPKAAPKKTVKKAAPVNEEIVPIKVDKSSDPTSPYKIIEDSFSGGFAFSEYNKKQISGTLIPEGVKEFRAHPEKYLAIHFQKNMLEDAWPAEMHRFTYVYREGTEGLEVNSSPSGKNTILWNILR